MTDIYKAAQQALELLDIQWKLTELWSLEDVQEKADQLRAALEQPEIDPVYEYRKGFIDGQRDVLNRPDEQTAEPVALHQALTDPENQPNQYGVEFLMRGGKFAFKVGNQQFTLDYEPTEPGEFEFMRDMLIHAFSTFTHDVKPALTVEALRQDFERRYKGSVGSTRLENGDTYLSPAIDREWRTYVRQFIQPAACNPAEDGVCEALECCKHGVDDGACKECYDQSADGAIIDDGYQSSRAGGSPSVQSPALLRLVRR